MSQLEQVEEGVMETGDWHRHFAWWPVWTVDAGWIWLRTVERKFSRLYRRSGHPTTTVKEFRPIPAGRSTLALKDGGERE